jgi:YbgC/YbaW family acyl-CoA thioester hydrolase
MNTKTLPKELESTVKIRFPDCDPFNHLNNSKYIDYIINAREDQLLKFYDFDIYKMAKETGNTWVVAQTQIAYLASAELMENVTIQSSLISFNGRNLMFEAKMFNEDKTQLKAVMWTKLSHYSLVTRKSQEHSESLMQLFTEVHQPIENNPTFDEHVKSLRQATTPI